MMNYLVLTRPGYEALRDDGAIAEGTRLWCNTGIIADDERDHWLAMGIGVRFLDEPVDPANQAEVVGAIELIEAYFPDETVLAEYC